ncbi:helix-turn-helix transcriptional regulator [Actinomadura sp. WMMA1423]|uniref:helix-turn-helix domain-containing protein n=1 Tax=Actinomadura sp. WMMA1423 TaxID=2591108 RepID=UPI0011471971|nr:helix-turn-helix transcriptional regulator [Actinomadura sp. WMMA1423]
MTPAERTRIGARLKAEREARGLSQRGLAELIAEALGDQFTTDLATLVDYVKRWERGRAGVGPRYQGAIAEALGMSQRGLFDPASVEDDPVQRRSFLGAAAVVGLAVTPWNPGDLPGGARVIGADDVEQLQRRTARLRRLDDVLGGADTYRVYSAEFAATRGLVRTATYNETTERKLLGVLAEQAQQAGWAALDAGQMAAARAHYRDSMTAASEAGHTSLMGNALALMSYHRVTAGQRGTEEADAACRVVDPGTPPAVRALLYERAAWAHAMAGPSHVRQVQENLGAATQALTAAADAPDPDWARWVDDVELQIMTGRCWAILRRPDRAVPALEWALARYDDAHARDKCLYMTWLAEAHLEARAIDRAAQTLSKATTLGADVASARPGRRIRAVAARLHPHAATAAVAEVLEKVKRMCPGPAASPV